MVHCGWSPVRYDRQAGTYVYRLTLSDEDLCDNARYRGRHLGVHLVGGHLEEHFVLGDRVSNLLRPAGYRTFSYRLAELGHGDVSQRANLFR
jgi:hypothetical protein